MKVNIKKTMFSLEGEPIKAGKRNLTLGDVIKIALQGRPEIDRDGWEQKIARIDLAQKVYESRGEVDLSDNEVSLVKRWVGIMFSARICGQVRDEIDPAD